MCITERNTLVYQIVRSIGCVGETAGCACCHCVFVEAGCCQHAAHQGEAAFCSVNRIEGKFLVFLHVLVVGKRKSLHGCQDGNQCAVNTSGLTANQLGNVRVFLLRHNTASGRVGVIQLYEAVFVRVPDDNLLGQTA